MGQLLTRIRVVLSAFREVDAEYQAIKERIERSPGLPVNEPTVPFWSVPPANLPTSSDASLPRHVDVLVIGSGFTGLSCTRTLLNKAPPGLRVLVLEARGVCSGASGRNGGHIDPPLYHDYAWLKSEFGVESAKRIIRFRRAHHPALREAVEDIGALEYSQIRDTEQLDIYFERDTFDKEVKALEAWRKDMPEEAGNSRVVEGSEAAKMFRLSERVVGVIINRGGAVHPYRTVTSIFADLLNRYPEQLDIVTRTPCTGITPPSTVTPYYTVQTPRGTVTAHHIIHATNGWSSHLLSGMRSKIIPLRGVMTAQRAGTGFPRAAVGSRRAHIFYYPTPGFDYLTQLPQDANGNGGGELLFGGGMMQSGEMVRSEVGVADDSGYHLGIASHLQGTLPEYFGRQNWGAETVDDSHEAGEGGQTWDQGRVKSLWSGILGLSADLHPWVGRVPSVISRRPAPSSLFTRVSDKGTAPDRDRVDRSLGTPGEWVSAGYSGEGMVHAWLCAHALALMVLGLEKEESVHTWFPDEYRLTEKRWKRATLARLLAEI